MVAVNSYNPIEYSATTDSSGRPGVVAVVGTSTGIMDVGGLIMSAFGGGAGGGGSRGSNETNGTGPVPFKGYAPPGWKTPLLSGWVVILPSMVGILLLLG